MTTPSYFCPDCKVALERLYCPGCRFEFPSVDGVPRLLSRDPKFERTDSVAAAYDSIYAVQSRVWENQGRTPEFIRYFSSLLDRFPNGRSLEIGCGEGFLLASRGRGEKFAVDLSIEAIRKAQGRARAHFCLALAERLPFPTDYFDLVSSVGVMEHFLDVQEALSEIRRIVRPGGHYVSLTHVDLSAGQRIAAKISEFAYPRPRPIQLARWLAYRLRRALRPDAREFVPQPVQNWYTAREARKRLTENGFTVLETLDRRKHPDFPLNAWAVIYVARK